MAIKIEGGGSTNKLTDQHGNVLAEWNATTGELVAGNFFGVGVSWQEAELTDTGATFDDGTPSYRAAEVTYTNDTDKTIFVSLTGYDTSGSVAFFGVVDGVDVVFANFSDSDTRMTVTFPVPSGSTYSYTSSGVALAKWSELR